MNAPFPKGLQMPGGGAMPSMGGMGGMGDMGGGMGQGGLSPAEYAAQMMGMGQNMGEGQMPGQQQQLPPGAEKEMLKNMTDEQLLQLMATNPKLKEQFDKLVTKNADKLGLNKNKPVTNQEYIDAKGKIEKFLDNEGGIVIAPEAGMVYKSRDNKTGEKFFINLVQHAAIDEPEQKYLVDLENQEGIRIPMSFGTVREDNDKKGDICKVVDVIVNPSVIKTVKGDIQMNQFLQQMLSSFVEQKYQLTIDQNMATPNIKYKGKTIDFQRVKGKKAPKIQQLSEEEAKVQEKINQSEKKLIEEIKEEKFVEEVGKRPFWELHLVQKNQNNNEKKYVLQKYDGDFNIQNVMFYKYKMEMPLLVTGKFIEINVNPDSFHVKVNKFYEAVFKFPSIVQTDTIKSYFNTKTRNFYVIARPQRKEVQQPKEQQEQQQKIQDVQQNNVTNNQQKVQLEQKQQQQNVQQQQQQVKLTNELLDDLL